MTAAAPIAFVDFCAKLGLHLTAGQAVFARVAFDGADPADLPAEQRALAAQIFGPDVHHVPAAARTVVAGVLGARSGKSLAGAARCLHAALTQPIDRLGPGEHGSVLVVAPDQRLARMAIRYVQGLVKRAAALRRLVVNETADQVTLRRGAKQVTIEALPASRGGATARGRSLLAALMDEAAFFRGADYEINDVEIFRAIVPRLLPTAQLIMTSTPWAASGLLHDTWKANHNRPSTALAAHASTEIMRGDDPHVAAMVQRERQRDEMNYRREFLAEFLDHGAGLLFDPDAIDACVVAGRAVPLDPDPQRRAWAAIDLGLAADASALAIVRDAGASRIEVVELAEWRPKRGQPLVPGELLRGRILPRLIAHKVRSVTSDAHYIETVREHLGAQVPVRVAGHTSQSKRELFGAAQQMIHGGSVILPDHPHLVRELKSLAVRPVAGGGWKIEVPRTAGSHSDTAVAACAAIWSARQGERSAYPRPTHVARLSACQLAGIDDSVEIVGVGHPEGGELASGPDGRRYVVRRRRNRSFRWSSGGY